jgi:hypothetical protein
MKDDIQLSSAIINMGNDCLNHLECLFTVNCRTFGSSSYSFIHNTIIAIPEGR